MKIVSNECVLAFAPEEAEDIAKELAYTGLFFKDFPIHFFWMDESGKILGCNKEQCQLFGFNDPSEIIGKHTRDVVLPEAWENSKRCIASKTRLILEESYVNKEGQSMYFLSMKVPVVDENNNSKGLIGIAIDITKRKETEIALAEAKLVAEKANIAKSEFLANINHEFRTPLTGIVTVAEILRTSPELPESLKEYAEILERQSYIVWDLTEKLLAFQQAEKNNIRVKPKQLDILSLVRAVASPIKKQVEAKGVTLNVTSRATEFIYFASDGVLISQILQRLLDNAEKFTAEGQIEVAVNCEEAGLEESAQLTIQVKDTGIGIAANKLDSLLEPFVRVGLSDRTPYSGIGMGLAAVDVCVKALRGDLKIESKEGQGTTVTVTLPELTVLKSVSCI